MLFLPVGTLPWTVGGRENYSHALCRELRSIGWDARIAIHQDLRRPEPLGEHAHDGVPIWVLPAIKGQKDRAAIYTCRPANNPGFRALLHKFEPSIVHLHDFSVGANLLHVEAARRAGAKVLVTYHSPGQSCPQRSLLYRNRRPCDGMLRPRRCTVCRLSAGGVPAPAAHLLGFLQSAQLEANADGALRRVLTSEQRTRQFIQAFASLADATDRIHVYAEWARDLMYRNGIPKEKIVFFRTGLPYSPTRLQRKEMAAGGPLRIAFVGRCDPIKGAHVLVAAVQSLPKSLPVRVAFFGPYWDTVYGRRLWATIGTDQRFEKPRQVKPSVVATVLAEADVCVVPSLWLETGPLVVLESFAAGTPVLGSRLGGIAELVQDGRNGLLFEPGNVKELAKLIEHAADPTTLARLCSGIQWPRTMADVAQDTVAMYEHCLDGSADASGVRSDGLTVMDN
ncbi:MAG: glycosyltransferase [Terriglobales bacterium]